MTENLDMEQRAIVKRWHWQMSDLLATEHMKFLKAHPDLLSCWSLTVQSGGKGEKGMVSTTESLALWPRNGMQQFSDRDRRFWEEEMHLTSEPCTTSILPDRLRIP